MSDLQEALTHFRDTHDRYVKAWEYYDGTVPETFTSRRLRRLLKDAGSRFRVNYAAVPVNAVLNRLEVTSIRVPGDDEAARQADAALQRVLEDNSFMLESPETHRYALVYGDAYVMVWPSGDDETVDITFNSPLTTALFYDEEAGRSKRFAAKLWVTNEDRTRVNLYYPGEIRKYVSKENTKGRDPGDFIPYMDVVDDTGGQVWPVPNPYNTIPVFHLRTRRPYGRPEHVDAYGPQDMITKIVATHMASTDFQALPQRYALEDGAPVPDVDDFEDTGTTDALPPGSSDTPDLSADPGGVWWMRGVKTVGQFASADVDTFLKPLGFYTRAMGTVTDTPLHYFEQMNGVPSGESRRSAEVPLDKKVIARQRSFTATWREAAGFVLELLGYPDAGVEVTWAPPTVYSDTEFWTTVKAKIDAGVPITQVLTEAGYNHQTVSTWYPGGDTPGFTPAGLQALAAAVTDLATAVESGLITAEEARAALPERLAAATQPAGS